MGRKTRIGIIGTGGISHAHMTGYKALEGVEVAAACDLSAERREAFGERYGVAALYGEYREMLAREDLDAVSVCVWNNGHRDATVAALEAGCHVLCEKPMALNAREAREMQAAAERAGRLLMIGFVRRFGPETDAARDFLDRGVLGDIYYAKVSYLRRCGNPGGWFADRSRSGGGPLIDLGVHVIDLARYLMGNPNPVSAFGATFSGMGVRANIRGIDRYRAADFSDFCDVEDLATALVRFDNGAVMAVETSYSLEIREDTGSVQLFGTKGGASIDPAFEIHTEMENRLVDLAPRVTKGADWFESIFRREIAHFADCVANGVPCRSPAEDGVALMRIIDGIYESARTGREVALS